MITRSFFDKREVDETKRKEDFKEIQKGVSEYFSMQNNIKNCKKLLEKANGVVDAMLEHRTIELGETDRIAYLVPMVYYYVVTGKPIVISMGTLEYQKQLICEVQELYRNITGKKAKILNCIGNEAEIIVVHGVGDPDLPVTGVRYADLKSQSIAGNYITFCSHEFLIRDRMTSPDEHDLMYGFFTSKYDIFVVSQADKLNQSAANAAAKNWDYNSAEKLLKDLQAYAEGLNIGKVQVKKALQCLAELHNKVGRREEIEPSEFVPLKLAMEEISIPSVSEWGSFYSKERQAAKKVADQEFARQMDALTAICSCETGDAYRVVHEWNNSYVHIVKDEQSIDGLSQIKELIGNDEGLSLIIGN